MVYLETLVLWRFLSEYLFCEKRSSSKLERTVLYWTFFTLVCFMAFFRARAHYTFLSKTVPRVAPKILLSSIFVRTLVWLYGMGWRRFYGVPLSGFPISPLLFLLLTHGLFSFPVPKKTKLFLRNFYLFFPYFF